VGSKQQVRAFCLNDNLAINTAWANDFSYDVVLQRQLELSANPGDIFIAITGSGESLNIINALTASKNLKVESIALLGFSGGSAKDIADHSIVVKSDDMQIIENLHLLIGHWVFKALQ
jgi:D-sedoheptulose 7-phosphate isomerase